MMFDRKEKDIPPLKYKIGDKIMGYHSNVGWHGLVGGEIIEVEQSKSYLSDNEYKIKLEPELCGNDNNGKKEVFTGFLAEGEAQPFKQDVWDRAVDHYIEQGLLQEKAYLESIRMHRALRGEPDNISDEQLKKELEEIRNRNCKKE